MGEGTAQTGRHFAANLSRVGEKDNYDYLVRWVHNPRQRTRPYCPFEKSDLTAEDYAAAQSAFRLRPGSRASAPNDGHELQVEQIPSCPTCALPRRKRATSPATSMTLSTPDAVYDAADFMDDPSLKAQGQALVQLLRLRRLPRNRRTGRRRPHRHRAHQGRLQAHRAPGFRPPYRAGQRGVEPDGKKISARLWYDHKGFFEHKLENPAVYDMGSKDQSAGWLRMPKLNLISSRKSTTWSPCCWAAPILRAARLFYKPSDERAIVQRLVGGHQIQLHGLPPDRSRAAFRVDGPAACTRVRTRSVPAAHADQRRCARQSRMAEEFSQQSGTERHRYESRRRAPLPAGAHAHVLFSDDEIRTWFASSRPCLVRPRRHSRQARRRSRAEQEWRASCLPAKPRPA